MSEVVQIGGEITFRRIELLYEKQVGQQWGFEIDHSWEWKE